MKWYYIDEQYDFDQAIYWNEFENSWSNYEGLTGTLGRDTIRSLHSELRNILLF